MVKITTTEATTSTCGISGDESQQTAASWSSVLFIFIFYLNGSSLLVCLFVLDTFDNTSLAWLNGQEQAGPQAEPRGS